MTALAVVAILVGVGAAVAAIALGRPGGPLATTPAGAGDAGEAAAPTAAPGRPWVVVPEGWAAGAGLAVAGVVVGTTVWALTGLSAGMGLVATVALGAAGAMAPRALTDRRKRRRLASADDEVADLVGLLAVELRSGLGVDASIENVAAELDGVLAEEVRVMATEVRLGLTRHEAMLRLRERLPTANVERFVQVLHHAEQLGAPVAHNLDALAEDCTTRRVQRVREEAAKLPVKILFPVLFCIFPPMLVLLAGPAMVQIADAF